MAATPAPPANPTTAEVAPPTQAAARYTSSVLVIAVPSAESITVYDGRLVIAQVMLGARPPQTSSQLATVPVSGGILAVIDGTYRDRGVAVTSLATGPGGVYVTTASNSRLADNEVYRLAGGVHTTVAGGPGSPTTLSMGTATADQRQRRRSKARAGSHSDAEVRSSSRSTATGASAASIATASLRPSPAAARASAA